MEKILIIEDNDDVRENIAEILNLSGFQTVTASNGKDGIMKVRDHKPDLILCDIMMPELDGYGVLKILNSNPFWSTIPFIFLTAKAEKSDWRRGMSLGANDYLTKPFDDADLLESIEIRLRKSKSEKSQDGSNLKSFDNVSITHFNSIMKKLALEHEERQIKKREIIFEAGNNVKNVFFLIKGKVRIYRTNDIGKELTTRIVTHDEAFGFIDAINYKSYTKSAQALDDCTLIYIPTPKFLSLLATDMDFAISLLKLQASYATITENAMLHQAYSSVRKKVANALVQCFEKNDDNMSFIIQRDDLASISGTAKETLIRTLSDFKNEKLIDSDGSEITIKELNGLLKMPQ